MLRRVVSDVVPGGRAARRDHRGRPADRRRLRGAAGAGPAAARRAGGAAGLGRPVHQPAVPGAAPSSGSGCCALLDLYGIGFALAQLSRRPAAGQRRAGPDAARGLRLPAAAAHPRPDVPLAHRRHQGRLGTVHVWRRLAGHRRRARDRELLRDAIERVLQRARLPPAAAAGGRPAGHHRRGRAARGDGAGADPAGAVRGPAVDPAACPPPAPTSWPRPPSTPPNRWRVYAVAGASPAQSRVAQVAHRGFYLLSQAGTGDRRR